MIMDIIIPIVVGLVCLAAGIGIGILIRKKTAEREIGSAELEATRLINEAIRAGENRKKEMLLEAKDEIHKSRTEYEKEVKERRAELSKQERRLEQKESTLDKKTEAFERKEEELAKRLQKVSETQAQVDSVRQEQLAQLQFDRVFADALREAGGRNAKAIAALLDMEQLKAAEDPAAAVADALKALKAECAYLFDSAEAPPPYARGTGTRQTGHDDGPQTLAGALREKLGKANRL